VARSTPQLLKLSGIGPAEELREFGIEVRADVPGVGANLQDRYEISVVTDLPRQLDLLAGGAFRPPRPGDTAPDPLLAAWRDGKGPYTPRGGLLAVVASSSSAAPVPDLFVFAVPADFRGYRVGYAEDLGRNKDRLTWVVLKAHTNNRAGSVRLKSADPLDPPEIRFRYFEEGSDASGADLDAVVAGVKLARGLTDRLAACGAQEIYPGPGVDTDDEIRQYVRDNAWGHHACGTCAIGPSGDPNAVIDSQFRVRGVGGLRVVDASVFPRIPGYFIVTAVYMISEKAADVILADAALVPAPANEFLGSAP
jgi:choline dehydrogenase